ncbi:MULTISPECIES: hypothetical protein [unclassified Streptomyces]|uniref:hypothetical protein n=1 Tax=unclassified Streptomyces TaxID=2593676 RepID=UPI0033BF2A06
MAVLALVAALLVIVPIVMIGFVLALGRYEELLLPAVQEPDGPEHTDGAVLGH